MATNPPITFEGELAAHDAIQIPRNYVREVQELADQQGDDPRIAHACLQVGIWYACGVIHPQTKEKLIAKNITTAVRYIRQAADNGDAFLAYQVARCFDPGNEGRIFKGRNAAKLTVFYYKLALNRGEDKAFLELAYCYEEGKGIGRNERLALNLMVLAAYRNVREAQLLLAEYLEEEGKDSDAEAWRKVAGVSDKAAVLLEDKNSSPTKEVYRNYWNDNIHDHTHTVILSRIRAYDELRSNDDPAFIAAVQGMSDIFYNEILTLLKEPQEAVDEQAEDEFDEEDEVDLEAEFEKQHGSTDPYKTVHGEKEVQEEHAPHPIVLVLCIGLFIWFIGFLLSNQ